ncbi:MULTISPECIES: S41 family peptidase [Actinoalloteichus]|uniref:Tricorn protease homolog n=1 Tax=Actinoalloteichus fjordicus TaxID=1612552 RepID=A0AAC9L8L5_9PSEU|nr:MULTISPECIES: S41 family peptidase [Actinoalloteichus]APU12821.1 Tol biopolymer transport system, periplasmic component-related protein [Actinoalloteichus fjordicus]APU18793.1 Tol biopolymer transport system, periplasmic component-related protein [Actinoalloteichus sp. GBA129-24]
MNAGYLRSPHLHGELITFIAEDDVWLAPIDGGRAWRVSADRAPAAGPRFSPDGSLLAWTSRLDGDRPEVQVAPTSGGATRRLTYWGGMKTSVRGWLPGEQPLVLATTEVGEPSMRQTWLHAVPLDGGPAVRLPYGPVGEITFAPGVRFGPEPAGATGSESVPGTGVALLTGGGVLLSSVLASEPARWKRYRGGAAGRLWIDRTGDGEFVRLLPELAGSIVAPLWIGDRVAFLSDHEGIGNVYSCLPEGTDLRRHTHHTDFYARNATSDGSRIVYQHAGELWLLDSLDGEARRLDVRTGGPAAQLRPHLIDTARDLGSLAVDHTGRSSVVEVRGTVHRLTHLDGPATVLAAEPGTRARIPAIPAGVESDGVSAVWITDADGEDAIELASSASETPGTPGRRLAHGELGRVLELAVTPDGSTAAVAAHDGRLLLVDLTDGSVRTLTTSREGDVSGLAFSPDSDWLAWSEPGPYPLRRIRLFRRSDNENATIVDVTDLRFVDLEPVFTLDGKHLAFLSLRTFDPFYDEHDFDLAFIAACRPYLVPLSAHTPSPFGPSLHGRAAGPVPEGAADSAEVDVPPRTEVDVAGLAQRVVPFPVRAGQYHSLAAAKGGLLWISEPLTGTLGDAQSPVDAPTSRSELIRFDLVRNKTEVLVDGADDFRVSGDGTRLVVTDGPATRVVSAERKVTGDGTGPDESLVLDLARLRVEVTPIVEWRQAYDEAARLMRDHFWRRDMGGVDWAAVTARYRPLVDRLGSADDFVDLLWEVQGELNTSHAYVLPRDAEGDPKSRQGLLGADLRRTADGRWRIERILPGETSDTKARSPLTAPGVAARPGELLLAVNGRPVDPTTGPAPLLVGTADQPVELLIGPAEDAPTVAAGSDESAAETNPSAAPRRVVVVPVSDEEPLRYQDWVARRRAHVRALSGGRVGYLHVPDMQALGWAQLFRDLRVETQREALIVDLRENRGGHTSQLVVEKLAGKVIGWQVADDGTYGWTYPQHAPRGPLVAVADEFSGSDGDIANGAIKALGLGPVVGVRTWGGTVGIDMRYQLVDGTMVTQPRYATWIEGQGWGMENHGVDPDVEVVRAPQHWVRGEDPQLDTAVRIALETLAERPAAVRPALPPI